MSLVNKMKNKKYHTVGKVTKSDRNVVERGKTDTINTTLTLMAWYMHFYKSGGAQLVLLNQTLK